MSRDCFRSRNLTAPCQTCGVRGEITHCPTRAAGFFCAEHCAVCSPCETAPPEARELSAATDARAHERRRP